MKFRLLARLLVEKGLLAGTNIIRNATIEALRMGLLDMLEKI